MIKYVFLLLLILSSSSCNQEKDGVSVLEFIKMVKSNTYKSNYLPKLSNKDIEALISEADNFNVIDYFPTDINASFAPPRFTVGESLLWTVEAIRLFDLEKDNSSYPSIHPVLCLKADPKTLLNASQFTEAYNLYKEWWAKNKTKDFSVIREIDPLENSNYRWR